MVQGTILSGVALSDVIVLPAGARGALVRVDGWTAAAMTFKVAMEPGDLAAAHEDLYDTDASELSISSFSGGKTIVLPPALLAAYSVVIRSGVTATPVNQGADRIITIREY